MSASWFSRSSRRTAEDDIKPGNRYRCQLGGWLPLTATVLDLRPDLQGIPHVHFAIAGHPIISDIIIAFFGAVILLMILRLFGMGRGWSRSRAY